MDMGLNEQTAGIFAQIKSSLDALTKAIEALTVVMEEVQGTWPTIKVMFDSWEEQIDAAQDKLEAEFPGYTRPTGWQER